MKKDAGRRHSKRNIVLILLLALLCIGATELAACRHFAPEVYDRIMSPVRHAASVTVNACRTGLEAAARFCIDTGDRVVQFTSQTMDRAAQSWDQFWENLTAPEPTAPPVVESGPVESAGTTPAPSYTASPHTEALEVDGRTILTGGSVNVTYFCQSDEEWADQPYGSDTIGPYGCGPTLMAMVVASMTDVETDPVDMAAWAVDHGYWARGSGSRHSIVIGAAQGFGLEAETFPSRDPDELRAALRDRKVLVALVGRGHFTSGGHFILLRGVTLNGDILVADPNSLDNSLQLWDAQLILDELSSARDSGAPLWVISRPSTY